MAAPLLEGSQGSLQQCPSPQIPRSVQDALDTDDVLQCILGHLSVATGKMKHMMVCRRWAQNVRPSQRALLLKKKLEEEDIKAATESFDKKGGFPELMTLHVGARKLTDEFIALCGSSGKLTSLCIQHPDFTPGVVGGPADMHLSDCSADEAYERLFAANTSLQDLNLRHEFHSAPRGLSALEGLKRLAMHYDRRDTLKLIMEVAVKLTKLESLELHPDCNEVINALLRGRTRLQQSAEVNPIPENVSRLKNLREMRIHLYCEPPETFATLEALRTLTVSTERQGDLDPQVQNLPNLQKLIISTSSISQAPSGPSSLTSLEIWKCLGVRSLRQLIHLKGLGELTVKYSGLFREPMEVRVVLASLVNLQRLTISRLSSLEGLELRQDSLKFLDISFHRNPGDMPQIASLTRLEELRIGESGRVRTIPSSLSSLVSLKKLTFYSLPSLRRLEDGLTSLTSLRTLRILDCPRISYIPAGLLHLRLDEDSKNELIKLMNNMESSDEGSDS